EEGALAGAVRADDAADLAVVDGEVDVAVGDQAAIALGEACRLQERTGLARGRLRARLRRGSRHPRRSGQADGRRGPFRLLPALRREPVEIGNGARQTATQ